MSTDIKPTILDAAERLFAAHGVEATSLRAITAEAGVNLAAVNYHFGSKDGLLRAIFERRFEPLNARRMELFDELDAQNPSAQPPIAGVMRALIAPTITMMLRHPEFMRLSGWLLSASPEKRRAFIDERFGAIRERVTGLLARCLPDLPAEELRWRLHFIVGAMIHTWTRCQDLLEDGQGRLAPDEEQRLVDRLVQAGESILTAPCAASVAMGEST